MTSEEPILNIFSWEKNLRKEQEASYLQIIKEQAKLLKEAKQHFIAQTLTNVYTRAEENIKRDEKEEVYRLKEKEYEEKQAKLLSRILKLEEQEEKLLAEKKRRLLKHEEKHAEQLKEVECALCIDTMVDPVEIACGHNFCQLCFHNLMAQPSNHQYDDLDYMMPIHKYRTKNCPICRDEILDIYFPINFTLKNVIEKLK